MDSVFSISFCRVVVFLAGLIFFAVLENIRPFRRRQEKISSHYGKNLLLGIGNGLVLNISVGGLVVAYYKLLFERQIGFLNGLEVSFWTNLAVSLVVLDLATYFWHRAYHEWPLLWRFHQVHHSDRDLDVTSSSRFHLGEVILSVGFKMVVGAFLGPNPLALAAHESLIVLCAQFHHANIKIPEFWDRRWRQFLVTPNMHRVHHSDRKSETNSNYSNFLSLWDRIFKTYEENENQQGIVIGLKDFPEVKDLTIKKLLLMPLFNS